jgi:hypothetical protein
MRLFVNKEIFVIHNMPGPAQSMVQLAQLICVALECRTKQRYNHCYYGILYKYKKNYVLILVLF